VKEEEKLTKIVLVRLTPSEHVEAERDARSFGATLSGWMRRCVKVCGSGPVLKVMGRPVAELADPRRRFVRSKGKRLRKRSSGKSPRKG
jgi:hypothetical protein